MELLESRTISANALLDIVDLEDNIWAGDYFILETQQINSNSYMCWQGGTTAIHKISNKTIEHFSIC